MPITYLRKIKRSQRSGQRGNALVEGALTMTVFMALLMGVFDAGQLFLAQQMITLRANDAIRWASVNTWSDSDTPTKVKNLIRYGTLTHDDDIAQPPLYGLSGSAISVTRPTPDFSAADRVVCVVSPIRVTTYANAFVRGMSGSGGDTTFPTLTVKVSLPYEVSNGSSH